MSDPTEDVEDGMDRENITCWCGATGAYADLFDDSYLAEACGGQGYLDCYCGGDQCVCHNHGGIDCDGCEDCEGDEWDDDDDGMRDEDRDDD